MAVSPLLAVALGALKGGVDVREKKKADALAARKQSRQDLQDELELRATPGVSLEDTAPVRGAVDPKTLGPLLAAASGGLSSGLGLPGAPTPKGQDAGDVTLAGRTMNVRFDPTKTKQAQELAAHARHVETLQHIVNPRTKQPFTAEEAEIVASGKAKFADFKPEAATHIDPLSEQGIAASGQRAGAEAAAKKPYERAPAAPLQVVQDKDGNYVVINKKDASTQGTGVTGAPKSAGGGRGSATIRKAVASNVAQLQTIDATLAELKKHKGATGLVRAFPDAVNNRVDKKGVAGRASLANIKTLILHDRFGSAQTASEMKNARPMLPSETDDYDQIVDKLTRLRTFIESENAALADGAAASPGPSAATLTGAQRTRAAQDPDYAAFLRAKGHTLQ